MVASAAQHGGSGSRPSLAAALGVAVGALIVAGLVAADLPRPEARPAPAESDAAAGRFLDAWARSRRATWSVDAVFTRSNPRGRPFEAEVHHAQRPPDRLLHGIGSVAARRGDRELVCGTVAERPDELVCREGRALQSYDREVRDELELLRGYVLGPDALYAVRDEGPGCWFLRLRFELPAPPYGRAARFCFDPRTAAPTYSEIQRDEGTDVTRAVNVDGSPTDEDLAPPPQD